VKEIKLAGKNGQGKVVMVDDEDYEYLNQFSWCCSTNGYAVRGNCSTGKYKTIFMHRTIMDINDKKIQVDHIDRNKLNNQRSNLRECTNQQNNFNKGKRKDNTSGYTGIRCMKNNNKWRALIHINNDNIEDAIKVRTEAEKKHFGNFAKLNIISEDDN